MTGDFICLTASEADLVKPTFGEILPAELRRHIGAGSYNNGDDALTITFWMDVRSLITLE